MIQYYVKWKFETNLKKPDNANWLAPLCPRTTAKARLLLLILNSKWLLKMRLPFVQVTRFRLTLVGNFSNLAPLSPEIVMYAADTEHRMRRPTKEDVYKRV